MRKYLIVVFVLFVYNISAQKYASFSSGFYTNAGSIKERTTWNIEVGKQWDAFSVGLDIGQTRLAADTTWYTEIRPNLNVFQQGKWTNTFTIGLGYVFGAKENILTEVSTGIQYTPAKTWSYNMYFGTYYFSGNTSSSSQNFLGISIMYFFKK